MDNFNKVDIIQEAENYFLDYSMSVITGRAIPFIEDGLKPIHRRILYIMDDEGVNSNKPPKKCAKIVGSVIGRLSPHGDAATYDALVRLSQPWKMRYPLISITGNNGSIQDSSAYAAMRYTECKLTKLAEEMLNDVKSDCVDWQNNYDNSEEEPIYLPSMIPQVLMNGASGISVGFATDIPPHNLKELVAAIKAYIDNKNITLEELIKYLPGPDFPTGGIVVNGDEIIKIYRTGHGSIKTRAKVEYKDKKIIVREIPFGYETSKIVEKIKSIILENPEGNIVDVMDLSGRKGIEIVIECSKNAVPQLVFDELCAGRYAPLQNNVKCNFVIIKDKTPTEYTMLDIIKDFVDFKLITLTKIYKYHLKKLEQKIHILEGLVTALNNIDNVIKIIKQSESKAKAAVELRAVYNLSELQTNAILDMKLSKLTKLEVKDVETDLADLKAQAETYTNKLNSHDAMMNDMKEHLTSLALKYGDERRTSILNLNIIKEKKKTIVEETPVTPLILTITHSGLLQKYSPDSFTAQKKGGKGAINKLSQNDGIQSVFRTNTANKLLVFTNAGMVYPIYIEDIFKLQENGTIPVSTLVTLQANEKIVSIVEYSETCNQLVFITKLGLIKKSPLLEYDAKRSSGMTAIKLKENDSLLLVLPRKQEQDVVVFSNTGHSIRFSLDSFTESARVTSGSKIMKLEENGFIMCADLIASDNEYCFTLLSDGTGKLSSIVDYISQGRGGVGAMSHKIVDPNVKFVGGIVLSLEDDILITTAKNRAIRTPAKEINVTSRHTQGHNIITLNTDDSIVALTKISNVSTLNV